MSSIINTNVLSLVTQNNMTKSQGALNSAIQRLSSGMRINSAKDDAAGQAIANRFTANIKGLTQASRNANDGISLAQTTEGALTEVNTNLQRIRELAVQSANGSNSAADKASIQAEITQRLAEIDRTSAQTDFNGVKVLSSSAKALNVQVGANDGEGISIGLTEISSKTLGLTGFNVDGTGSANKGATSSDLLVAGLTAGATAGGVTPYTKTFGAADTATVNNVLAKMQDTGTVAITGGATYTYSATTQSYTATEATRTGTNTLAAITPPSGASVTATIKLGTNSTNVKIDSNGAITSAADGSALYLDASNNLTATGSGVTVSATLTALLSNVNGMKTADDSITFAATGASYTSVVPAAAGAGTFAVANEQASAAMVAAKANVAGAASTIDIDGTVGGTPQYDVSAAHVVQQSAAQVYNDISGSLTTAATQVLNLNSNGVITDASANQVYADSANPGKLTTKAVSNATATVDPLKALDAALAKVDSLRGELGAVQNRFDSVISNLGTTVTNLSASRSRIEDADYATEVSNMSRANILQQAGTSVLAQANQTTQGVLSLLR